MPHAFFTIAFEPKRPAWQLRCAALFLAGMVFVLACFATSPQLQAWLHGSVDPQQWACCQGVAACGNDASTESSEPSHNCSFFVLETHFAESASCPLARLQRARFLPLIAAYVTPAISAWIERAQARAPPIKS
jgi:hypothetical protein